MLRRSISRPVKSSVVSTNTSINLQGQKFVPVTAVFHPDKPPIPDMYLNRFLPRDQKYGYDIQSACVYDRLNISSTKTHQSFKDIQKNLESKGGSDSRPIVSVQWLHKQLQDPELSKHIQVIDATWVLKKTETTPYDNYLYQHIPTAIYFDIDAISEPDPLKPHRFPTDATFNRKCSELGISNAKQTIIYDSTGYLGSARALWTFQQMGFSDTRILSGGFQAWKEQGYETESGRRDPTITFVDGHSHDGQGVVKLPEIIDNIFTNASILVDARSAGRFDGTEPEPRDGFPSGHIPGSKNIPYNDLIRICPNTNKVELKTFPELMTLFRDAGIPITDPNIPIITTCGSGITASALYHAFKACGFKNVRLYDGSWLEYAAPQFERPIQTKDKNVRIPYRELISTKTSLDS